MKYLFIPLIIILALISCTPEHTEQDKAFFLAYYDNDYETVRKLARQVNVNVKWFDQTPLQVAIDMGDTAMVKLFIDKGADVIVQDLYDACRNETVPIVRLLIENGADINAETRQELEYKEDDEDPRSNIVREEIVTTPLSAAAEYGNWEVVHFLVENGANYKKRDIDSYLNGAAYSGNLDFFILLIDKGAHINSKSDQGVTLLHSACKGGNADIISYLIEQGFNVNSKDADGRTTLYSAASMEHLNLVRMLINLGVDFKSTDNYGNTLLHAAAGKNTVQFFIDKGISVNVKNEAGKTPLHLACASNELEKTKTLIKNNADINAMDHEGNTPLLGMFTYFDYYISEYYNTRSRNFRKNNVFRESALIRRYLRACRHLQDETYLGAHYLDEGMIIKFLVNKGADLYAKNINAITILHGKGLGFVSFFIEKGVDLNAKDSEGKSPLHMAAFIGILDIVQILVENGAELNTQDTDGNTPIHVAYYFRHTDVIDYLKKNGASLEIKNKFNQTPPKCGTKFYPYRSN